MVLEIKGFGDAVMTAIRMAVVEVKGHSISGTVDLRVVSLMLGHFQDD